MDKVAKFEIDVKITMYKGGKKLLKMIQRREFKREIYWERLNIFHRVSDIRAVEGGIRVEDYAMSAKIVNEVNLEKY